MIHLDFYFDYIDPASFVMDGRIRQVAESLGIPLNLHGWELRLPGEVPIPPDDPLWLDWWEQMRPLAKAAGLELQAPARVPATRKAHELRLHATETERADAEVVHQALFRAVLSQGADVGRVDVLVGLALELGLDRTEARAVLDVDRFSGAVDRARLEAIERGVAGAPTLVIGESRMEGVHDAATIREFVTGSMDKEGME